MHNTSVHQKSAENKSKIRRDFLSAIFGITGLILAFTPNFSVIGVVLSLLALMFVVSALRKKQKSSWAWLGLLTGGLTILALLIIIGLIRYF